MDGAFFRKQEKIRENERNQENIFIFKKDFYKFDEIY